MAKSPKKRKRSPEAVKTATEVPPQQNLPRSSAASHTVLLFQAALIIVAGLWIYWPALIGAWIRDDTFYLPQNPLLHDPARLWETWFQPGSFIEYYPIEETIQFLQWNLWQNDTLGYHLTNVVLHITSAFLFWHLLRKLGARLAWLGGLIFVVHPMQVESVAWISEFKNTLCLPPFLLALCAWIDFDTHRRKRDYALALALFLVAMLCKISMIAFPILILLYAGWKRGRIGWGDLKASIPFAIISLALGITSQLVGTSYQGHHLKSDVVVPVAGFLSRMDLVGLTSAVYFSASVFPYHPMPLYPLWVVDPPSILQFLPWPIMLGVAWWLWKKREDWGHHALFGLAFFFLFLAPFLGFVSASYMRNSWVMDHFLYLPILGIIGLIVAGCSRIDEQLPRPARPVGIGIVATAIVLMAWESHSYAAVYQSEEILWNYMADQAPDSSMAQINLGDFYYSAGRYPEAIQHFNSALQLNPTSSDIRDNIGTTFAQMGQNEAAIQQFKIAAQYDPKNAAAYNDLAGALINLQRYPEAIDASKQGQSLEPNSISSHLNMAVALRHLGRLPEAISEYQRIIEIDPGNLKTRETLAEAFANLGQYPSAVEQFEIILQSTPQDPTAHNNLGVALYQSGHASEGIKQLETALQLNPDSAAFHNTLGFMFERIGQISEAQAHYLDALQINPNYTDAQANLKRLQGPSSSKGK